MPRDHVRRRGHPHPEVFTANAEIASYDVAPDGQKFLVLRRPPPDFLPFNVIVNWPANIR